MELILKLCGPFLIFLECERGWESFLEIETF